MSLKGFFALMLGDRSAVLPSPPTPTRDAVRETRFAEGLAVGVSRRSPYTSLVQPRDGGVVPTGWHPGMPPVLRIRGVKSTARDTLPNATVQPLPADPTTSPRSYKVGTADPIGLVRKVVRR
jgi:hypothetical protein